MRALVIVATMLAVVAAGCSAPSGSGGASDGGAGAHPTTSSSLAGPSPAGSAADLPALALQATIDGFSGAATVTTAADGIWVLDHSAATLVRIDPATNRVTARIALGPGFANGLGTAGGRLWTFEQTTGEVVAVDPTSAKKVASVKRGQDGDWFWVGDDAAWLLTAGHLVRIDGSSARVTTLPVDPTCGVDGAASGGGFVWLASAGGICKLDEKTGAVIARASGTGNGSGLAIIGDRPWVANIDGGLSILDPKSLAVATTMPAPPSGIFQGSTYSLGHPGGENTVVVGAADGATVWVRFTGATIGRVKVGGDPSITVFAGFMASTFAGGLTQAFGSLWLANFDGGSVQRYALPTP